MSNSERLRKNQNQNSPDLNPLDYSLWSIIEDYVFRSNPSTLNQVKSKVKQCVDELNKDPQKVRRIVQKCSIVQRPTG